MGPTRTDKCRRRRRGPQGLCVQCVGAPGLSENVRLNRHLLVPVGRDEVLPASGYSVGTLLPNKVIAATVGVQARRRRWEEDVGGRSLVVRRGCAAVTTGRVEPRVVVEAVRHVVPVPAAPVAVDDEGQE